VWSPVVVVLEQVWQQAGSVCARGVAAAASPFARHGLVEAFDFAVGAWPVGLGGEVADAAGQDS
jgi:hypothetical protein